MSLVPDHIKQKYGIKDTAQNTSQKDGGTYLKPTPVQNRVRGFFAAAWKKIKFYFWLTLLLIVMAVAAIVGWVSNRESYFLSDAQPSFGRVVETEEAEFYIQEFGAATNTPIVILPGFGTWNKLWRPTTERLANDGWYAVSPDIPPFGFSERPFDRDYSRATQATQLGRLLNQLTEQKAIIVAHSTGARPAVELAMTEPDRVGGLILVSPDLGGFLSARSSRSAILQFLTKYRATRYVVTATLFTNPLTSGWILQWLTERDALVSDTMVADMKRPLRLVGTTDAYGYWLYTYLVDADSGKSMQSEHYKSLTIPVVLIWGEEDPLVPVGNAYALESLLASSSVYTLKGVGHLPHLEDPSRFHDVLFEALKMMPRE